jgi:hypothetical protein
MVVVGMVRGDMLRLVRPLVPHRFDRRSAKIGDRVGDVLVDCRNAILRRAYPGVIFLAAIAPTATPTAPPAAAAVAVAIIGPGGAGRISVLIAGLGLRGAFGRPVRRNAFVFASGHVGWRLIVQERMRFGPRDFAFRRSFRAQAFLLCVAATSAPPPSPSPSACFAIFGTLLGGLGSFTRLADVRVDDLVVVVLFGFGLLDRFLDLFGVVSGDRDRGCGRLRSERPGLIRSCRWARL